MPTAAPAIEGAPSEPSLGAEAPGAESEAASMRPNGDEAVEAEEAGRVPDRASARERREAEESPRPEPRRPRPSPASDRQRRVAGSPASSAFGEEAAEDPSPAGLMRAARASLRGGDASGCVSLVDRAIESGASTAALRLRGDCLVRAGDRAAALRSYERFCLLAPDHPAIGEVRALVESLGGRCN